MSKLAFKSINPYESRFPNRRVLSKPQINLIKYLRSQGHQIIVEPEDSSPIYMLTQKGVADLIPSFIESGGDLSLGVLGGLIANYLSNKFHKKEQFVIERQEQGVLARYSIEGKKIPQADIDRVNKVVNSMVNNYSSSLSIISPYSDAPHPLYLEHTGVVVGWCAVKSNEKGLLIESARVTSQETMDQIKSGALKGFSIGGLIKTPICSVCMQNYIFCEHISGAQYHGVDCVTQLTEIELAEISLVKSPANSLSNIEFK